MANLNSDGAVTFLCRNRKELCLTSDLPFVTSLWCHGIFPSCCGNRVPEEGGKEGGCLNYQSCGLYYKILFRFYSILSHLTQIDFLQVPKVGSCNAFPQCHVRQIRNELKISVHPFVHMQFIGLSL